jgi:hypothetical protein
MRSPLALVLVALTACASSGGSATPASGSPASQTVRIDGVGSLNVRGSDPSASVKTLPFAIADVWRVLPAVYDSLGIPVTRAEQAQYTIANDGMKVRARLGKASLSRYLDCGNTQMGPSADNYEVYLTIGTMLRSTGPATTVVETALDASARPIQFAQAPSKCSSRGELEPRVFAMLMAMLATTPRR